MQRRRFIAVTGGITASVAGCLSKGTGDARDGVTGERDGVGDDGVDDPAEGGAANGDADGDDDDPSDDAFETAFFDGETVTLVPTDVAYEWFEADTARFVDTRSVGQYEELRIEGAVHSPFPDGHSDDDPVADWPVDTRIVTYCVCPHRLAGGRAASLIDDGYEAVYALDEGLQDWVDREYPIEGSNTSAALEAHYHD